MTSSHIYMYFFNVNRAKQAPTRHKAAAEGGGRLTARTLGEATATLALRDSPTRGKRGGERLGKTRQHKQPGTARQQAWGGGTDKSGTTDMACWHAQPNSLARQGKTVGGGNWEGSLHRITTPQSCLHGSGICKPRRNPPKAMGRGKSIKYGFKVLLSPQMYKNPWDFPFIGTGERILN